MSLFISFYSFSLYQSIHIFLLPFFSVNMVNNIVALNHGLSSLFLCTNYLLGNNVTFLLKYNGIGYFLYDMNNLFKTNALNKKSILISAHHISSIYFIYNLNIFSIELGNLFITFYFWAEISNIMNYLVYILIKLKSPYLKQGYQLQLFINTIVRIFITNYYYYKLYVINNILCIFTSPLYIISIYGNIILWDMYFKKNYFI